MKTKGGSKYRYVIQKCVLYREFEQVKCGQGRCPTRAEHRESVFLASFLQFPYVAASTCLHNIHNLSCDLAQDNQARHPLTIPKD